MSSRIKVRSAFGLSILGAYFAVTSGTAADFLLFFSIFWLTMDGAVAQVPRLRKEPDHE